MRHVLCFLALATSFVSCSRQAPSAAKPVPEIYMATAYSVDGETASGTDTRRGIVAADPDVLPLGTRIQVSDAGTYSGTYTVTDTGLKVKGKMIDIFMPSWKEAKEFGKQQVRVEILTETTTQTEADSK